MEERAHAGIDDLADPRLLYIRATNTLSVASLEPELRRAYRALASLYDDAYSPTSISLSGA